MLPHGRCHGLENGGSSYSISQSISRFTETQVGINRRDNDNNELHDLDRQLLDIEPVKSDQRMKPRTVGWWFILSVLFTFLKKSRKTSIFSPRNDSITHDKVFIYYSYNRSWISFVFQIFNIMSLHFQLLSPPITTVSRSKPKLKVLIRKAFYFRSHLEQVPKLDRKVILLFPRVQDDSLVSYFVSICKRNLFCLWILPYEINYIFKEFLRCSRSDISSQWN